jgi:hypothetical protein
LLLGARSSDRIIHYLELESAWAHGAGVERATSSPGEAYAPLPSWQVARPEAWPGLPWSGAY